MSNNEKHTLFVYGTLKKGFRANQLLNGQTFLGAAKTEPKYKMYKIGGFPGIVDAKEGKSIEGELWCVDAACLRRLDSYEGYPTLFNRKEIKLSSHPEQKVKAYYFNGKVDQYEDCGVLWT